MSQTLPQAPQFRTSSSMFVQPSSQQSGCAMSPQAPHIPQNSGSRRKFRHRKPEAPPQQPKPSPQLTPHTPQFASVVRSATSSTVPLQSSSIMLQVSACGVTSFMHEPKNPSTQGRIPARHVPMLRVEVAPV